MSLSAKMIDRRTSTPRGNHSYGPFFLEYSLLAEYNLLRKQRLPGVYVIPSTHTPLCKFYFTYSMGQLYYIELCRLWFGSLHITAFLGWYGIIFIRQGIYQEGIFRFKIIIPENYPDGDCPVSINSTLFVLNVPMFLKLLITFDVLNIFHYILESIFWSSSFPSSYWTIFTFWNGCPSWSFEKVASQR